jgi:hypothetical protein
VHRLRAGGQINNRHTPVAEKNAFFDPLPAGIRATMRNRRQSGARRAAVNKGSSLKNGKESAHIR